MRYAVRFCFTYINVSISIGLMFGLLILLRPVLKRVLSPQQRVVLWTIGWLPVFVINWYEMLGWIDVLPVNFRSLITPRMSYSEAYTVPAFLPDYYSQPGSYNVALPGNLFFEVEFTPEVVTGIFLVWLAGFITLFVIFTRRERVVKEMMKAGTPMSSDTGWLANFPELKEKKVEVRICENIPTSFVCPGRAQEDEGKKVRYTICLQKELQTEQMALVLQHELSHISLLHCYFKGYSNVALVFHWFNPVLWLGNKYFCQDLELACDRATLKQLTPHQRKDYAHTLVDLAVGPQLWDVPVCFGESDAELRVKEIVVWKLPETTKERAVILGQIAVFGVLFLFLSGEQNARCPRTRCWSGSSREARPRLCSRRWRILCPCHTKR